MSTIFFPSHLDSGNRGCEAITKGTCEILGSEYSFEATTQNMELDSQMGYSGNIVFGKFKDCSFSARVIKKLTRKLMPTHTADKVMFRLRYASTFNRYKENDLVLSTGGDMFCYGDDIDTIRLNDFLYEKSMKTVLWGCSIGEENLSSKKIEVLNKFAAVTVRESLSECVLKEKVGLKNVFRFPDSAFVLKPEKCELPAYFSKDVIGINLSNFVGAEIGKDTIFGKNIICLFNYILNNTQFDIVLIPHVFWKGQDDRISCNYYYDYFKDNYRIHVLSTENMNYCQIRYAISKCKFFLGARTHAMISAYSTCVPSIALGYSIKSKGIAKDLNMPDYTVLDYRNLKRNDEIVERFKQLQDNEAAIRRLLSEEIPGYIQKAYNAKQCIDDLEGNK